MEQNLLYFLLIVVLSYPIAYVDTFCHELGHAVLARLVGIRVTAFGLGTGRPFLVSTWRGVRVYLGLQRPFQGLTLFFNDQLHLSRIQVIGFFLGGILAEFLLGLAALAILWLVPWFHLLWIEIVVITFMSAFINWIPFSIQIGAYRANTDGANIVRFLRTGGLNISAPARVGLHTMLHRLLDQIGDRLGSLLVLLSAIEGLLEIGLLGRADKLCQEAHANLDDLPPLQQGVLHVFQSLVACETGRLEEATLLLEQAEQKFRAVNQETGLFLVDAARVDHLRTKGDLVEALATLDKLAVHPVAQRLGVRSGLIPSRLALVASLGNAADVQKLSTEYQSLRRLCPSLTRDLGVFGVLGRWYTARESWIEAADAYRLVLKALQSLHKGLGEDDQKELLVAHAKLLAEIKNALQQAGRQEEANAIETLFVSEADPRRQALEAWQRRDRRWCWVGGWITRVNLLLGVAGMAGIAHILLPSEPRRDLWTAQLLALPFLVFAFGLSGVLIRMIGFVVGYFAPALRYKSGFLEVGVGVVGWFIVVLAITVPIVSP